MTPHLGVTGRLVLWRAALSVLIATAFAHTTASAQPTELIISADVAVPGDAVTLTLLGEPGYFYALVGSPTRSGLTYGGIELAVGTDYVVLAAGVFDASGTVTVKVVPPFHQTTLDRYYFQAASSPNSNYLPLSVSTGGIVRNGDLFGPSGKSTEPAAGAVAGTTAVTGGPALPGATGPEGPPVPSVLRVPLGQ